MSSLSRYMEHVVRPMSETERRNDFVSWNNIGRAERDKLPFVAEPRDPRLCNHLLPKYGILCTGWGSWVHEGKRWCAHHKPAGAERR